MRQPPHPLLPAGLCGHQSSRGRGARPPHMHARRRRVVSIPPGDWITNSETLLRTLVLSLAHNRTFWWVLHDVDVTPLSFFPPFFPLKFVDLLAELATGKRHFSMVSGAGSLMKIELEVPDLKRF